MILPNNGKVVVIDDTLAEIKDLLLALTKEKMPFLFFSDREGRDLPEENKPLENVRLVFLDLDLGLGNGSDPKTKIRLVQERLVRIIKEKTPYVLVIWSNHESELYKYLEDEFNNGFKEYKPVFKCSLDKTVLKRADVDVVKFIQEGMKENVKQYSSFNAFMLWETLVNDAVGQVTNELTQIFPFDDNWDKNIKNLFYQIAFAELGSEDIEHNGDDERLNIAVKTINTSLVDYVEKNIDERLHQVGIQDIKQGGAGLPADAKISLHTGIHLVCGNRLKHPASGNLYLFEEITMENPLIVSLIKSEKRQIVVDSKAIHVVIDVTPACDYAQRRGYTRLLHGILFDGSITKAVNDMEFVYKQCPVMNYHKPMNLVFDFKTFEAYDKKSFLERYTEKPKYRLRTNLLLDVQAQLANHINRPGIFSLK
jgi:hypothetical protein